MNRRPKLSLDANRALNKRQALDSEPSARPTTGQGTESAAEAPDSAPGAPYPKPFQSERLVARNRDQQQRGGAAWHNGKPILKAMIVVLTAALSIYLLKRRLL